MELYHYGRKGMKWGQHIYGVDSSTYKTYSSRSRTRDAQNMVAEIQKYSDKEWRSLKGLLATMKIANVKMKRVFESCNDDSGFRKLKKAETSNEAVKKINPNYKKGLTTLSNNCLLCSVAYDMRRRGYDVVAKQKAPIDILYDIGAKDAAIMYQKSKIRALSKVNDINKEHLPLNARGIMFVSWAGHDSGHVVAFEMEKSGACFYDAQSGDVYPKGSYNKIFNGAVNPHYIRTDNLQPNYNFIKLAVE